MMNNIQEVIVYRNPMEAVTWDFLMSADGFVFITGMVVFVLSSYVLSSILDNILRKNVNRVHRFPLIRRMFINEYTSLYLGAIVTGIYVWWMI
jgi:hypothetical protein